VLSFAMHENLVGLLGTETSVDELNVFLALEPVVDGDMTSGEGVVAPRTLERVIAVEGLRDAGELRAIMRQMSEGLAYLHGHRDLAKRGLTHRDLKPQNVLVKRVECVRRRGRSRNQAKLADFGSAKLHEQTMAMTQAVGTAGWQSPEGVRGDETGPASDVFSLGLLFFYCLTGGGHPFGDDVRKRSAAMRRFAQEDDEAEDEEDDEEDGENAEDREARVMKADAKRARVVDKAAQEACAPEVAVLAVPLMTRMLKLRPADRPTADDVARDPLFSGAGDAAGAVGGGGPGAAGVAQEAGGGGEGEDDECAVCFDGVRTHAFVPCGHRCVCEECAGFLMQQTKKCPICQQPAQQTMQVFQ
jgi:serine/threonine protein kinase